MGLFEPSGNMHICTSIYSIFATFPTIAIALRRQAATGFSQAIAATVAMTTDKSQMCNHDQYMRCAKFQIGKQRVFLLQPGYGKV